MTKERFEDVFNKLVQAFNVAKAEDKVRTYYLYLQKIPDKYFDEIVTTWIKTQPRFPSISDLLSQYFATQPPEKIKKECDVCDGFGMVKVGYLMYRGDCDHGRELNRGIKIIRHYEYDHEIERQKKELADLYGETYASKFDMVPPSKSKDIVEIVSRSPEQCFKGILYFLGGDAANLKNKSKTFQNFAMNTIELLGKKRCQEIKEEWLKKRTL